MTSGFGRGTVGALALLGLATMAGWTVFAGGSSVAPRLTETAVREASRAAKTVKLFHQHDGGVLHQHDHDAAEVQRSMPARGRSLEVSLGGDQVKSFFVLDEIVLGLRADRTDREVEKLFALHHLSVVREVPALGAVVARFQGAGRIEPVIAKLAAAPVVAWAEPNYVATVSQCDHSPFLTGEDPVEQHNDKILALIGLPEARTITRGSREILVAVLDSGVDAAHEDLTGTVVPGKDFVNGDDDATDDAGHGTGIAGLIAARDEGHVGIAGIAPACRILPVKVADRGGKASFADLASGIVWAVDQGARVLNISLGSRTGSEVLKKAVEYALSHRAVVVAAAGNDNTNQVHYPAAYDGVIAVGALSPDGTVSAITNLAPRVDVAAPGERLISTLPAGFYRPVSGTSTSAAIVSGAAALLLSLDASLDPTAVRQALIASARPVECLATVSHLIPCGRVDLPRALARATPGLRDLAVAAVRTLPAQPVAGLRTIIEVDVVNAGAVATAAVAPEVEGVEGVEALTSPAAGELAPGARRTFAFAFTPRDGSPLRLTARVEDGSREEELRRNNTLRADVAVGTQAAPRLDLVGIEMTEPSAKAEAIRFRYTIRNTGSVALAGVALEGTLDGHPLAGAAAPVALAVGETAHAEFAWTLPNPAPSGTRFFRARFGADGVAAVEKAWTFIVGNNHDGKELDPLYQQAGEIDIIADAPHRVIAERPYVPLMIFVPHRGTAAVGPILRIDHVSITAKASPEYGAPGMKIYEDSALVGGVAEPTVAVPGLVQVDEMGDVITHPGGAPDLNLFSDAALTANGRHSIFRVPRAALGVPASPAAPLEMYFQVDIHWKYYALVGDEVPVKSGVQKWTLRTTFGADKLPTLPGENHYFDTHNHTIAEWYQSTGVEPFAPMQAYGGPIQMIKESAYVIGMIEDPADTFNKVITTDHNTFYKNPLESDPDGALHRPPFGPTSPAASVGADGTIKGEFRRMREMFGMACGEELAFSQDAKFEGYPIPIGAHMLGYRASQQPGTWHGGSHVSMLLGEGVPLFLSEILETMAADTSVDAPSPFNYAAHPYSAQGWFGDNIDMTVGVNPIYRNYDFVSKTSPNFLLKGLQLFNGWDPGSVAGEDTDWGDVNPWIHPSWSGSAGWDRELQVGLRDWHAKMAKVMAFSFYDKLGKKFIRKVFISAGSDAHGNFNYSSSRLATLIPVKSTMGMSKSSFGSCRSYMFTEGKAGATLGERAIEALADGNHVATDGPLAKFAMDSEGRFDSKNLVWHDKTNQYEDADGRIGGGGAFDGEGTMLVRRSSPDVHFGYRYANTPDYGTDGGAVKSILVYKTALDSSNPLVDRPYATSFEKVIKGVGSLATGGEDKDLTEKLSAGEEGLVSKVSCYSLGAFTGSNPDVTPLGPKEHRCYTNPVWAIPYDVEVTVKSVNKVDKRIDAGELVVKFTFDLSMMPLSYKLGVKKLSAAGTTSDKSAAPLASMTPLGVWGTNFTTGADFAKIAYSNAAAIPLSGEEYPSSGKYTFMVYFEEPLKDVNGNALHSIATTFSVDKPSSSTPPKKCFVEAAAGTAVHPALPAGLILAVFLAGLWNRRPRY